MWGIGIIGAGSYGEQHAQALASLTGVRLVAASRTNAPALHAFTQTYGGTPYTDYHDLLRDESVQVVMIATPHHLHIEAALAALHAGKNVLLEKPLAPNRQECDQIVQAVREAGVKFMVGHVNHFVPAYQVAKQIIESGEMGEVVYGLATMQKYWMESNRRDWHLNRETGGGVWLTVGIHPLDRLTWLVDSPVTTVSAQFSTRFHPQQADDAGMVFLRYANGAAGTIVSTGYHTGAPKHLTELTCTRGMLNVDYTGGVTMGREEHWQTIPESLPTGDWMHAALVEEWRQFIQSIEQDTPSPVPADFAAHIMDVAFAAEQSSQEQHEIAIHATWSP
ncbi:MAG: Gfo/Idh/MocA family oxidoreductase [Anaerolineaceae bacterium]|nr:Gfo/Idh/MocA family oxidoreductase [Anaerolineaceae bacterium]